LYWLRWIRLMCIVFLGFWSWRAIKLTTIVATVRFPVAWLLPPGHGGQCRRVNEQPHPADKFDMQDWCYPYYCGAGRGARAKYNEVAGRWRKRIFRRPRLISVGLAAPIVVVAMLEHHHIWLWILGVLLGGLLTGYIALIESPPARIENWRTRFEGERRTARALASLRRCGYVLLHDLPDRRPGDQKLKGGIDHVVVCGGGVFLLNSKWLGGEASIKGDTVHIQMRDDDDDSYQLPKLACGMRGCAIRLQEDIAQQSGVGFVQAVVVFWNKFDAELVKGHKIVFVHGERLVDWLEEQSGEMTPEQIAHVTACIKQARPPEHRALWDRLPTLGLRGRHAPVTRGAAADS
jgi:Nuclease-related domain